MEGRAGHVLLAPFDHQDVVATLLQQVGDAVLQVACVFDLQLLAGHLRAADAHQENVLACRRPGSRTLSGLDLDSCSKHFSQDEKINRIVKSILRPSIEKLQHIRKTFRPKTF